LAFAESAGLFSAKGAARNSSQLESIQGFRLGAGLVPHGIKQKHDVAERSSDEANCAKVSHGLEEFLLLRSQASLGALNFNAKHPSLEYSDDVSRSFFCKRAAILSETLFNGIVSASGFVLPGFAALLQV
jgi:hypothetical protein